MSMPQIAPSLFLELCQALGTEGEIDYQQLLKVTKAAQGSFFLFFVESDFSHILQEKLLDQFGADLSQRGLQMRRVILSQDCWNIFDLLDQSGPVAANEVFVLAGFENTPEVVHELGRKVSRAPIFALLNQLRETLRAHLPAPLVV